jgi:hypothetical protein
MTKETGKGRRRYASGLYLFGAGDGRKEAGIYGRVLDI